MTEHSAWERWSADMMTSLDWDAKRQDTLLPRLRVQVEARLRERDVLFAVFGSVARREPADDLDIIVVSAQAESLHSYSRVETSHGHIDLNLVQPDWIEGTPEHEEWGLWLCEGVILSVTHPEAWEERWLGAANRVWSLRCRLQRWRANMAVVSVLSDAAARTQDHIPFYSATLAHEAARTLGSSIIESGGTRWHSHRGFLGELHRAAEHLEFEVPAELSRTLVSDDGLSHPYVRLRHGLSELLRDDEQSAAVGYSPQTGRNAWLLRFASLADTEWARELEKRIAGTEWARLLPAGISPVPNHVAGEVSGRVEPRRVPPMSGRFRNTAAPPLRNPKRGFRWIERQDGRVKAILSGRGCRVPTCAFCGLPAFAAAQETAPLRVILTSLREMLSGGAERLSLYTDGSFLDRQEISEEWLSEILEVVRESGIARLDIETLPRFVRARDLADIKTRSGVQALSVAMGLQAIGDWFSVGRLGRPDVDALFDRAVWAIHRAGALSRIYLLYGFSDCPTSLWLDRLRASLGWCAARDVERVTICEFVDPRTGRPAPGREPLESVMGDVRAPRGIEVDYILASSGPSCAPQAPIPVERMDPPS